MAFILRLVCGQDVRSLGSEGLLSKKNQQKPDTEVADLMIDQSVFSGLGNIMKNKILFIFKMHPQTLLKNLNLKQQKALVKIAEKYSWQFYKWKKLNVLKRN